MGIEHSKHIFRIFILLAVVVAAAFIGRIVYIKIALPSFGRYGHFRADALPLNAAIEVRHGGDEACGECHEGIKETHDGAAHVDVRCENCHDALAAHVKDGQKVADMPRVKSVLKLCGRCHRELTSRPADFPQVNIKIHPVEMGADEATDEVCFDCHSPHDPTP